MDKISKIKDYIERLKHEGTNPYDRRTFELLCEIGSYINNLPEEPVSSIWHDSNIEQPKHMSTVVIWNGSCGEVPTNCVRVNSDRMWAYMDDLLHKEEEPVSEDLEEEIIRYIGFPQEVDEDVSTTMIREAAHHFANWQKEQFEKNRLAACDAQTPEETEREMNFAEHIIKEEHRQPTYSDAIEYGMRLQKEQMMKDAIDATIEHMPNDYGEFRPCIHVKVDRTFKKGEKVKVIIMKEEQE